MGDVQNVIETIYNSIVALGSAIVNGVSNFFGTGAAAGGNILDSFFNLSS